MNYAQVAEELRAIAENLDADVDEVRELRASLANECATNARLRRRVDALLAQEDLHTVEGLRKELKRLNGLLNVQHEQGAPVRDARGAAADAYRNGYEAGRAGEGGGHP